MPQVAHTGALAPLLVAGALPAILRRRHGWAALALVALGPARARRARLAFVVLRMVGLQVLWVRQIWRSPTEGSWPP